jgi:CDP-glucose 4,6-dehydratase
MLEKFYKNKRVLVTGDTGFKGTWLVATLIKHGAIVQGYSLSEVSKPSHHKLLKLDYNSDKADIRDIKRLEKTILKFKPEIVFHLAAQSLVIESYYNPLQNFETNFNGTLNILECLKNVDSVRSICIVTTDKVYKNKSDKKTIFTENDSLGGYDPYSASKAAAEILSESYYKSFFEPKKIGLCTVRSGNVIGGGDWAKDRIVPDIIRAWQTNQFIKLRYPNAIRPWQHVMETIYGYLLLTKNMYGNTTHYSGAWNFGPNKKQLETVEEICKLAKIQLGSLRILIHPKVDFKEADFLALNSNKAKQELNWENKLSFEQSLAFTFDWYKAYYEDKKMITHNQIEAYLNLWK